MVMPTMQGNADNTIPTMQENTNTAR